MSDNKLSFDTYSKWKKLTSFQKCCVRHHVLKNFKVPKYGKLQLNNNAPKKHTPAVHKKKKLYICKHCEDTFFKISELHMHMKNLHEKKKSYKCSKCKTVFSWRNNLVRHIEKSHTEQKEVFDNPPSILGNIHK